MGVRCTRNRWPASAPRKGTASREAIIMCIRGATIAELLEHHGGAGSVSAWKSTLLDQKGILIENIKGTYLLAGFYRRNGRFKEMPGFADRAAKLILKHKKRLYKKRSKDA